MSAYQAAAMTTAAWAKVRRIPARNFALALLDLAKSEALPPNIQKSLGAFEKVAEGKADLLRQEVENWYNSSMDRYPDGTSAAFKS